EENRAKVVAAEAEIPLAIAQAFRGGQLAVLDELHDLRSHTDMPNSIGGGSQPRGPKRQSAVLCAGCRGKADHYHPFCYQGLAHGRGQSRTLTAARPILD